MFLGFEEAHKHIAHVYVPFGGFELEGEECQRQMAGLGAIQ
jgi:hypothetical protein